jgi:hypothetical protein
MYQHKVVAMYIFVACCQTIGQKDEKTSTGCRKGAGTLFLNLRATGETKNKHIYICRLAVDPKI